MAFSLGTVCSVEARNEMPRNMMPRQVPITMRVERAFFHSGFLNAGHAVGDGLDAGHRGAAGGEGVQHQEHGRRHRHRAALGTGDRDVAGGDRRVVQAGDDALGDADARS